MERSRRREAKASHVASLRWLSDRRGAQTCVLAFPSPPNQVDRRVTGPRNLRAPCTAPAAVKSSKMPNKMLIDATHPEETRVVVVRGNRVEEFDFETAQRKQPRGNIYLAKVTRVEPSLQAAFIEYGGNRHGFLAFSEIHPDYYRIPVSDRLRSSADPSDRNGDHDRDNDPGGGEDMGVPLASALPEPVQVPHGEAEDDLFGDESDGEAVAATEEAAPPGEILLREDARREPPAWEDGFREDAPTQWRGTDAPFVADSAPTETGEASHADSAAISAPDPADRSVTAEREHGGEAQATDREPATIALRAAEESVV